MLGLVQQADQGSWRQIGGTSVKRTKHYELATTGWRGAAGKQGMVLVCSLSWGLATSILFANCVVVRQSGVCR